MTIEEVKNKRIGLISLGCDKNRVDLEKIIFNLKSFGFQIVGNPEDAEIIIVNTCAFLESARLEAIENILDMSEYKSSANLEKLVVTGCLNELNYQDLTSSLPEVDAFVNIKDNDKIVSIILGLYNINLSIPNVIGRSLTTPQHYAYLKISEGCNNFCTYCLIPYIRGRYKSEDIEELVNEATRLSNIGIKELILVAQDVTKYGVDIYGKKSLVELIRRLSAVQGIEWIRLLYCYPEEIDDDLISEIRDNPKVLKYLDIPLQHVSSRVLKAMNRRSNYESICTLFDKLKNEIPDIIIRSTFIVGFPGETEEDVDLISKFLKTYQLQNVGFFKYSREEGTNAYKLSDQIDEKIKESRYNRLYSEQYEIINNFNQKLIGRVYDVIVDESNSDYSVTRFYGQAPEIDTVIFVDGQLPLGEILKVKIIDTLDYDLKGEIYDELT
ncbi:MAG: 30S ribosomal protein S12 methylthiotransferase RimO [Clostridiales bacterium]|nr:30S ribosomal protein S12 methylthiotransferase RimO [Clostridiales bacterium]